MHRKRIGIGLVGAGWMGNEHSQAYRRIPETWPEAEFYPELAHVADNVPAAAQASAQRWAYRRSSTDWRAVVADPEVDVVDITGPNSIHRELALAAAAAGKQVACEKPLGRSASEAADIAAAVASAGVLSNCNFQYRYNPAVQHLSQLLEAGAFGQITHFRALFLTDFGWNADAPFAWRFDGDVSGWGALGDIGSHTVDLVDLLAGPVREVVATERTIVHQHGGRSVTNDDYVCALLRLENDAVGTFEISRVSGGPKDSLQIAAHGTRGAFAWDSERMNEVQVFTASGSPDEASDGFKRLVMGPSHPWYGRFCPGAGSGLAWHDMTVISQYLFLRGVAGGPPTETDFRQASRVAAVLGAMQVSHASGRWEPVTAGARARA